MYSFAIISLPLHSRKAERISIWGSTKYYEFRDASTHARTCKGVDRIQLLSLVKKIIRDGEKTKTLFVRLCCSTVYYTVTALGDD